MNELTFIKQPPWARLFGWRDRKGTESQLLSSRRSRSGEGGVGHVLWDSPGAVGTCGRHSGREGGRLCLSSGGGREGFPEEGMGGLERQKEGRR